MSLRMLAILGIAFLLVLFAVQNTDPVGVHLLVWEVTAPASVAVFVAFACGVLVGALFFWTEQRRTQRRQGAATLASAATPVKKKQSWWW